MNTDKLTTWLGIGQAVAIAVIDFWTTSSAEGTVDIKNPMFWGGLAVAAFVAIKAYFTNKPSVPTTVPVK